MRQRRYAVESEEEAQVFYIITLLQDIFMNIKKQDNYKSLIINIIIIIFFDIKTLEPF